MAKIALKMLKTRKTWQKCDKKAPATPKSKNMRALVTEYIGLEYGVSVRNSTKPDLIVARPDGAAQAERPNRWQVQNERATTTASGAGQNDVAPRESQSERPARG